MKEKQPEVYFNENFQTPCENKWELKFVLSLVFSRDASTDQHISFRNTFLVRHAVTFVNVGHCHI